MLTSKDIKLLIDSFSAIFATKFELQEGLQKLREEMATKDIFREVMTKIDVVFRD